MAGAHAVTLLDDVTAAGVALRRREVSAVQLAREALERGASVGERLGAFAALTPELALEQARRADDELAAGEDRGPLHGIPIAIKDVIDVAGVPTRLGTRGGGHRVPRADAAAVSAAVRGGAVVIGKTTTHELALGMVTPQARNPMDPTRITGGSSGGSAAAVAAGIVPVALGTDTNGSIRCPAALCGVVGLKPTFGAVGRTGVATLAWSQDTVGALAADVESCGVVHAVCGPGKDDARTTGGAPLRVGIDRRLCATATPAVSAGVLGAVAELQEEGVEVVDVTLDRFPLAAPASFVTILAEAAAAWPELTDAPGAAGLDVRAALLAGAEIPAVEYIRAARVRTLVLRDLDRLMSAARLDALALPAVPVVAAPAGADAVELHGRMVPIDAVHPRFTAFASLCGVPALSVPCGLDAHGLPIGLQLVGVRHGETALLRIGALAERADGARAVATARRMARATLRADAPGRPGAAR